MRKGFQKLAAQMLVEKVTKDVARTSSPNSDQGMSYVSVEKRVPISNPDGSTEVKKDVKTYEVPSSAIDSLEQAIDAVGDSPEEKVEKSPAASSSGSPLRVDLWIEQLDLESSAKEQIRKIFDKNLLADPNCANLYGSLANSLLASASKKTYEGKRNQMILDLAMFVPTAKSIQETTGKGEYALAFLFGTTPTRSANFDLVVGNREYTVKNRESGLNTFQYKFGSSETKRKIAAGGGGATESQKAAELLGLIPRSIKARDSSATNSPAVRDQRFVSSEGRTRWALVCNATESSFEFQAFSISNRLAILHDKERKKQNIGNQIVIRPSYIKINLEESLVSNAKLINELSRRDQQDVEAIARRIAQEVLEDELGDDFDKAVRREMLVSLKDKEVESGVADVSRDFMRKFYRSLGTGSSSPLDKVKV